MTYKHRKTEKLYNLVEQTETSVTLVMLETGETKETSLGNFKRWWQEVSQNEPEDTRIATATPEEQTNSPKGKSVPTDDVAAQTEMTMSEIVLTLETLFDKLNAEYYDGVLVRPIITVQKSRSTYGHFTTKKIWQDLDGTKANYEINISADWLLRPIEEVAATLNHEMVHLFCQETGIKDTCQKGRYHNKAFKAEAEARGLLIDYRYDIGYSLTTPTEEFTEFVKGLGLKIDIARNPKALTAAPKEKPTRVKNHYYICPTCGQTVATTKKLSLICGECKEIMEMVEK